MALGLVAALAMVSPALGGPSLKSLVKQEVANQLAASAKKKGGKGKRGKRGKPGKPGKDGRDGVDGAAGSARGYAAVVPDAIGDCEPDGCDFSLAKNVAKVIEIAPGNYCIDVTGSDVDTTNAPALATIDAGATLSDPGTASVMVNSNGCPNPGIGDYQVETRRIDFGTQASVAADDVGFVFMIP